MRSFGTSSAATRRSAAGAGFLALVGAAVLAMAAAAFACTPSNMVALSATSGNAGTPVGVTGTALSSSEVVVRWNGEDGPVLTRTTPADLKRGNVKFNVPDAAPGYYLVTAVQTEPSGDKLLARATFQVVGAGGQTRSPWDVPQGAPVSQEGPGAGLVMGLALGFAGLSAVGGAGLVLTRGRRRPVAATAASHRQA